MNVERITGKYIVEHQFYKDFYKKNMLVVLMLGSIAAVATFLLSFSFEDFIIEQSNTMAAQMLVEGKEEMTNVQKFYSILSNNLFVGAMIILCGFIPIYGISFICGLLSFVAIGLIAGYGMIMEKNVLQTMLIAFVPHAVIEIIPMLYSIAVGLFINKNVINKLFFKRKKSEKFKVLLKQGAISYLMIVIPLFFLAALIEAFITTRLVDIFLK